MASEAAGLGISVTHCHFIPERIKCIKVKQHKKLFVVVWRKNHLVIYNSNKFDVTNKLTFTDQKFIDKDDLNFEFDVFDVLTTTSSVYVVDVSGTIFELHYKEHHLEDDNNRCSSETEMFELSPECQNRWTSLHIGSLKSGTLLAISVVNGKFVAISKHSEEILGTIYKIGPVQILKTVSLFNRAVDKAVLSCTDVEFSKDIRVQYFPSWKENFSEKALVGLSSGQIVCLLPDTKSVNSEVVFSSTEPILSIEYNIDKSQKLCTAIFVLYSSGQLMVANGKCSQSIYIPGPLHSALFNNNISVFFTSDGIDSLFTKIRVGNSVQDSCTKCMVKGVRAMCIVPDIPEIILASTISEDIYWLDMSNEPIEESNEFVMPQEEIMRELLSATKCLKDANNTIEENNSVLRAISMASRAKYLDKYFTILVKVYSGRTVSQDKLKLRLECDCDFLSFTPDIWTLNTMISFGENSVKSFENKLDKILSKDFPLVTEIKCSPIFESELSCKMVARINFEGVERLLIIPVGKIIIDAGYFFTVVKDKMKFLKRINEHHKNAEDKCEGSNKFTDMDNRNYNTDGEVIIYSVRISEKLPIDRVLQMVLRNSSHRITKNQWLRISDSSISEVVLAVNDYFWVELSLDKLTRILHIKSNDPYVCYSVKRSVSSRMGSDNPVKMDVNTFLEAERIKYRYELARVTENCNLKELHNLKQDFRSHFS